MHPSVQENAYVNGRSLQSQLSSWAKLCGVKFGGRMGSKGIRPPLNTRFFLSPLQASPGPGCRWLGIQVFPVGGNRPKRGVWTDLAFHGTQEIHCTLLQRTAVPGFRMGRLCSEHRTLRLLGGGGSEVVSFINIVSSVIKMKKWPGCLSGRAVGGGLSTTLRQGLGWPINHPRDDDYCD